MRSRASSFKWEYPLLSPGLSSNFLRLLPRLLVTSICQLYVMKLTSFRNTLTKFITDSDFTSVIVVCQVVSWFQTSVPSLHHVTPPLHRLLSESVVSLAAMSDLRHACLQIRTQRQQIPNFVSIPRTKATSCAAPLRGTPASNHWSEESTD
jgi:hypothetical protein